MFHSHIQSISICIIAVVILELMQSMRKQQEEEEQIDEIIGLVNDNGYDGYTEEPIKPQPNPISRSIPPALEAYQPPSRIYVPSSHPRERANKPSTQYRTLIFKPWSGTTTKSQAEYMMAKDQPEDQIREEDNQDDEIAEKLPSENPVTAQEAESTAEKGYFYRFQSGYVKLIRELLQENGFREAPESSTNWTIYWSCTPFKLETYDQLLPYQKINHFPNSFHITRKDLMNKSISKMQIKYGYNNFNFLPRTYILPQQLPQLQQQFRRNSRIYIVKPHNRSQGKGIIVSDDLQVIVSRLEKYSSLVVSQYIENPLLINGFKFDLRIYVGITSVIPLRLYIYEEGLARFATELYTTEMNSQKKNFRHLTNYSVNKKNENFVPSSTGQDDYYGSKWSLTSLRDFLEFNIGKAQTSELFQRIDDLVIKTILSIQNLLVSTFTTHVPYTTNCFQILGFDVLIDNTLKPWLIEVNHSPSMNTDSPLDLKIKGNMVADMFTMMGVVPEASRYVNGGHLRHETVRFISVKGANKGESMIDKMVVKESEQEEARCGRWRRVYPLINSFKYRQFFEVDRYFNALLREMFFLRRTSMTDKSSVSTAVTTINRASSKPKSKNIRVVKKRDIRTLKRL